MKFFLFVKTATITTNFSIKRCSEKCLKLYIKGPAMRSFLITTPSLIKTTTYIAGVLLSIFQSNYRND